MQRWSGFTYGSYAMIGYGLGLMSLGWHAFRGRPETRRRTRVMLAAPLPQFSPS
jgi:hypothetical protein